MAYIEGEVAIQQIIVGNKTDLDEDREISKKQGEEFAHKNECGFHEISAKEDNTETCKEILN